MTLPTCLTLTPRNASRRALYLLVLLVFGAVDSQAGPRQDGRLFLHVNPDVTYTIGADPSGLSGLPVCEEAILTVPISGEAVVWYVMAAFPHGESPELPWASFGIDYDSSELTILDSGHSANQVEIRGNWPEPGSGVRFDWNISLEGNSIEIGWFAGYPLGDSSTEFRLQPGPFEGYLGGERIAGYGSLGFGTAGDLICATVGTCCFENGDCTPLTENWCDSRGGVYFDGDSCESCSRTGACCMTWRHDWRCQITNESSCTEWNESWAGEGTVCEPNACIPEGACCLADRTCLFLFEDDCREREGQFTADVPCSEVDCAVLGACCHWEVGSVCRLTTEEECSFLGSMYQGDGEDCEPGSCAPGLCCIDSRPSSDSCLYTTVEDCDASGGSFRPGAFGPPRNACWERCWISPVLETSWGEIKQRFRSITQD